MGAAQATTGRWLGRDPVAAEAGEEVLRVAWARAPLISAGAGGWFRAKRARRDRRDDSSDPGTAASATFPYDGPGLRATAAAPVDAGCGGATIAAVVALVAAAGDAAAGARRRCERDGGAPDSGIWRHGPVDSFYSAASAKRRRGSRCAVASARPMRSMDVSSEERLGGAARRRSRAGVGRATPPRRGRPRRRSKGRRLVGSRRRGRARELALRVLRGGRRRGGPGPRPGLLRHSVAHARARPTGRLPFRRGVIDVHPVEPRGRAV